MYGDLLVAELFLEEHLGQLRYGGVLGPPDVRDVERPAAGTAAQPVAGLPAASKRPRKAAFINLPASSAKMCLPWPTTA